MTTYNEQLPSLRDLTLRAHNSLANFIGLLNKLSSVSDGYRVENPQQAERQKIYSALGASVPRLRAMYQAIKGAENRHGLQGNKKEKGLLGKFFDKEMRGMYVKAHFPMVE